MPAQPLRIAVIGAGPIGLEAALYAARHGFDVRVYEQGRIAEHIGSWGHVRMFSPFSLNTSSWGRDALTAAGFASSLPAADELLTGRDFLERYLLPLSRLPDLSGRIHESARVLAISRTQTWKGELIGNPNRHRDPFLLLIRDSGSERTVTADYVLDCSGTYGNHNYIGAGGIPCPGESTYLTGADYLLPDILGSDRTNYADRTTLVVGNGYSAATSVVALATLSQSHPATKVFWITKRNRPSPMPRIDDDALPERDRLAENANTLATSETGPVTWLPGYLVTRIDRHSRLQTTGGRVAGVDRREPPDATTLGAAHRSDPSCPDDDDRNRYLVEIAMTSQSDESQPQRAAREQLRVDRILANVGYRPDRTIYEELQVHECYATQGPIKLAGALLGETSTDCLLQSGRGVDVLRNPEPGFFIVGSKSYGRDSRFLLKVGLEQIRDVFALIVAESEEQ